jgi:hypothetical protein
MILGITASGCNGSGSHDGTAEPVVPARPEGLSASAGDAQNTLSWNAVTGATSYHLYWSTTPGVTKATGTKISNVTKPYVHKGLTNDTPYYYIVTASNDSGESEESSEVSATPSHINLTPVTGAVIIDHTNARIDTIPEQWITVAKQDLHIAYGHTSHGSQLTTGMVGLSSWKGDLCY